MKTIVINSPLHGTKEILVDDEDYEMVNKYKWCVIKSKNTFYATRNIPEINKVKGTIIMHRAILGLIDTKIIVDHKNHNGLDNQKLNLRICTQKQNCANKSAHKNSTSKYLGVNKKKQKYINKNGEIKISESWEARIMKDGKSLSLKFHKTEEDAARAYDKAAKEIHGEFANLNFK